MNPKVIMEYLLSKYGLSPEIAAGMLGNAAIESGFDPEALNENSGAFGLFQWLGVRKRALRNYAWSTGDNVDDWKIQIDFAMHELQTDPSWGWDELQQAKSPEEAAQIFFKKFERAGDESGPLRSNQAIAIYNLYMSRRIS